MMNTSGPKGWMRFRFVDIIHFEEKNMLTYRDKGISHHGEYNNSNGRLFGWKQAQ